MRDCVTIEINSNRHNADDDDDGGVDDEAHRAAQSTQRAEHQLKWSERKRRRGRTEREMSINGKCESSTRMWVKVTKNIHILCVCVYV